MTGSARLFYVFQVCIDRNSYKQCQGSINLKSQNRVTGALEDVDR